MLDFIDEIILIENLCKMQILKLIIDSKLLAVLIGGLISIASVYIIELIKARKEKKKQRVEIFQNIKSNLRIIYRYAGLETQMDILFAFHERMGELLSDPFHKDEAQRRLHQKEEFALKFVSVEAELNRVIAAYYWYFSEDSEFESLVKKFEDWDNPAMVTYKNINDPVVVNKKRKEDEERTMKEIDESLGKYCEQIIEHVRKKL